MKTNNESEQPNQNFIGDYVSFFLQGGWKISGVVLEISEANVILQEEDGSLYLIKRDHVSGIHFNLPQIKTEESIDSESAERYHVDVDEEPKPDSDYGLDDNGAESESLYGSIIPGDMLIGESNTRDNEFSISMTQLRNPKKEEDVSS